MFLLEPGNTFWLEPCYMPWQVSLILFNWSCHFTATAFAVLSSVTLRPY